MLGKREQNTFSKVTIIAFFIIIITPLNFGSALYNLLLQRRSTKKNDKKRRSLRYASFYNVARHSNSTPFFTYAIREERKAHSNLRVRFVCSAIVYLVYLILVLFYCRHLHFLNIAFFLNATLHKITGLHQDRHSFYYYPSVLIFCYVTW